MTRAPGSFTIALVAIGMLSVACDAPVYDRASILRDAADEVIVPGYATLAERATAMHESAQTLCTSPTTEGLVAARASWTSTFEQFEHTAAFGIGPAREMNLSAEMGFWPISPDAIERNVAAADPIDAHYVDALGAANKGLLAIAYLLEGGTPDAVWTPPPDDAVVAMLAGSPRRCAYLVALTEHVARTSHALSDAWSPSGGDYAHTLASAGAPGNTTYPDVATALVALFTQMLDTLKTTKNTKLGIPIGHRTMMPSPRAIESPFAEASVLAMRANVAGVNELWTGGGRSGARSFDGLLESRDPALAAMVRGELDASVAGLAGLDGVLTSGHQTFSAYAAGTDHSVGETGYSRVDLAETTLATQVAGVLGLNVGFSDMDGD